MCTEEKMIEPVDINLFRWGSCSEGCQSQNLRSVPQRPPQSINLLFKGTQEWVKYPKITRCLRYLKQYIHHHLALWF